MIAGCVMASGGLVMALALAPGASASTLSIRIVGNHFVNGSGQTIRLLGVDRSGSEYACIGGWGFFDGPSDANSVAAMAAWHINAVRVPLNEDCWLNINGASPTYSGANYQNAIVNYVNLLHQYGIYAILDLHWNAPGGQQSTGQLVMADQDHAPALWTSVATVFKNDPAVIFDLYNEPHDVAWSCWQSGCNSPGWQVAGMQSLLNAVRSTGATQAVMAGGLAWSNDLSQWLSYRPSDPLNQLAASLHMYNFNSCNNSGCWASEVQPVAAQVPVVTGELGEDDCAHGFIDSFMNWADAQGISYLGWAWNPYGCGSFPALITDYNGTPTNFGVGLKNHLAQIGPTPPPTPTPTPAPTPTPTPRPTPTPTPAPTPTPTPAPTPTPTPVPTPTPTPSTSATPGPTPTQTPAPTPTPTAQPTPTPTPLPTPTPAPTPTTYPTATPTATPAPTPRPTPTPYIAPGHHPVPPNHPRPTSASAKPSGKASARPVALAPSGQPGTSAGASSPAAPSGTGSNPLSGWPPSMVLVVIVGTFVLAWAVSRFL